jgi:hypothetical protein
MNSAIAKQNGVANESTQTQRYDKNTALVIKMAQNVAIQDQRTMTNMAKEVKLLFARKVCII